MQGWRQYFPLFCIKKCTACVDLQIRRRNGKQLFFELETISKNFCTQKFCFSGNVVLTYEFVIRIFIVIILKYLISEMKRQNNIWAAGVKGSSVPRMGPIKKLFTTQKAGGCVFYSITLALLFAPGFLLPAYSVNWLFNGSVNGVKTAMTDSSKS